ncbi:DNA-directed RNA polymerase II subunit RPB1 [Micractinium conductrix]|uniref:DNA-directed RNA polymerase II subunit RPB1 n=1 Tax=Micractinium conductrix TaxID=554055 RepID=A0A2P6VEX1_9CHLO|nr:DNA-directed RNA polymerase II subunit RPB1 [Micractinium conductrix]|eukprot:PSC72628.1 DNA-directed RNA polymerase II subunit RPB1 [Micractinium conductrix]
MARASLLLGLVLACALVTAARAQGGPEQAPIQELPAFSTVQLCVPFNVFITPSDASTPQYGLQVDAELPVAQAILWTVTENGTLQLEAQPFTTQQPIKVAVYLPPAELAELDLYGMLADTYVGPGFSPESFTLRQGAGAGGVYAFGLNASSVAVSTQGGTMVLLGTYGSAQVNASGIANVFIATDASVQLGGISNVYLETAGEEVQISGSASGISRVFYTQGQCQLDSVFLLQSPCQQVATVVQAPVAEGPYAFQVAGPTGTQQQAGAVQPGSSTAQAGATGQRQASSVAIATPGKVSTGTQSDGQGIVAGTTG